MMKTEQLLEKHPRVTEKVKEWFLDKMMKSLKSDEISDDFKEIMKEHQVDDESIIRVINGNPHALFEFFDANKIFIGTSPSPAIFSCYIYGHNEKYNSGERKVSEKLVLDEAFKILEEKYEKDR